MDHSWLKPTASMRKHAIFLLHFSSHQIDYLALTQASVNQLPGSSDVNNRAVSVGSSVSDTCRKF